MKRAEEDDDKNSIKDITTSLENILNQLQSFSPGDSIYKDMRSTKRGRVNPEQEKSPETASPPKKAGKKSGLHKTSTRITRRKTRDPLPSTSLADPHSDDILSIETPRKASTPLSSTPATSTSSIPESIPEHVESSDDDFNKNQTIIRAPRLTTSIKHNPMTTLSGVHKYTVEQATIDYITGKSPIKPREFNQTIRLWFKDKWNNLENPPDELTSSMFIACIPPDVNNQEKIELMMVASSHLEMARISKRFVSKDAEFLTKDFSHWFTLPDVQAFTFTGAEKIVTPEIQEKFVLVLKELLDTVRVIQKDIDRNAFLFRSICVDTAQGFREGGEKLMREVKSISETVAASTTPIGTPTRDKATAMPPPSRPITTAPKRAGRPVTPASVIMKPKK